MPWCEDCLYYDPDLATYESADAGFQGPQGRCLFARVHRLPDYMTARVSPRAFADCSAWAPRMALKGGHDEGMED
jgi:hypothetical protein